MKKQKQVERYTSVRLGIIFVVVVTVILVIALTFRTIQMYQRSIYQSDQPFTLHITSKDDAQEIISFRPVEKKITRFSIKHLSQEKSLTNVSGIPSDARVYTKSIRVDDTVPQQLKTLLFRLPDAKTTLTLIDLLRLYTFSQTVQTGDTENIQIDKPEGIVKVEALLDEHFLDNQMREDNKTIQIINASGISGMGSSVEKTINRIGAAVIDVQTARKEEATTKIEFTTDETYTIQKMRKLFHVPIQKIEGERISDIIITLGKDKPLLVD